MDEVISRLPAGPRIVSGVQDTHVHTFAVAGNPYITARSRDSARRTGSCVVQDGGLPLPLLIPEQGSRMAVRNVKAGTPC